MENEILSGVVADVFALVEVVIERSALGRIKVSLQMNTSYHRQFRFLKLVPFEAMRSGIFLALLAVVFGTLAVASPNPAYVCSFCIGVLGLVEESLLQVHLENTLASKCPADSLICQRAVKELILSLASKAVPEDICNEINACPGQCKLFSQWPVNPLPDAPPSWPIERKLTAENTNSDGTVKSIIRSDIMSLDLPRKLDVLKPIFEAFVPSFVPKDWGMWAPVAFALAEFKFLLGTGGMVNSTAPLYER